LLHRSKRTVHFRTPHLFLCLSGTPTNFKVRLIPGFASATRWYSRNGVEKVKHTETDTYIHIHMSTHTDIHTGVHTNIHTYTER
jgi:hypothetical protein